MVSRHVASAVNERRTAKGAPCGSIWEFSISTDSVFEQGRLHLYSKDRIFF
jgi:hypothetical protein